MRGKNSAIQIAWKPNHKASHALLIRKGRCPMTLRRMRSLLCVFALSPVAEGIRQMFSVARAVLCFVLLATGAFSTPTAGQANLPVQTLTLMSGNGVVGGLDAQNQFSPDGGVTWQQ